MESRTEQPPQQADYDTGPRTELVQFLPRDAGSVIEVGCARGSFGPTLRARYGSDARIVGIDPVVSQTEKARLNGAYDEVFDGYFPEDLDDDGQRYDLVTFNDVLEHTVDPWGILQQSHARLSERGRILAVIPSIQYAPVLWRAIRGRWDYADWGTLDRTHLRFFTKATAKEMFEETGYVVDECTMMRSVGEDWAQDKVLPRRLLKRALLPLLGDSAFLWVVIVAHRSPAGRGC